MKEGEHPYVLEDILRKRRVNHHINKDRAIARRASLKSKPVRPEFIRPEKLVETNLARKRGRKSYKIRQKKALRQTCQDDKLLLVVRIRGTNDTSEEHRRVFNELGLRRKNSAKLFRSSQYLMDKIHTVQNFVAYGQPKRKLVDQLVFKRLRAKVGEEEVQISSNQLVEDHLSGIGCICLEDVVDLILTGNNEQLDSIFKFVCPFRLGENKRLESSEAKHKPFAKGGFWGDWGQRIAELVEPML